MNRERFKELLHASFKSEDTEEWLDVHFTRPVGLVLALVCKRLGIHPNAITIVSIFLGMGAAWMFWHTDIAHNLTGVALLMAANFCDSADGQLARITGQKTLVGRVLDGFAGDVWFFCIYFAVCMRMMPQNIPGTEWQWGMWIWVLAYISGIICHTGQSSLADYYRQIHLFFLKGKEGSELDTYRQQRAIYDSLPPKAWLGRIFYYNYANYCKRQERRTPKFQAMMQRIAERYQTADKMPATLRQEFISGSRPLMKYTNILTFNVRAICIYISCVINCPWLFMVVEITLLAAIYIHMHSSHEAVCESITRKLNE